jgi:hypothetical protein
MREGIAMWKTRNSSPYLQPGRLNDVLAAIQTMALYRYYRLSVEDWAELISNSKEAGPRWRKVFDDHPEFFRPSVLHPDHYALGWRRALPRRYHYITKAIITSDEYNKLSEEEKKYYSRPPVPESQIKTLMDLAITLHQRAIDQARDWRWWVAPVLAFAGSFIGALIGGLAKLKLGG